MSSLGARLLSAATLLTAFCSGSLWASDEHVFVPCFNAIYWQAPPGGLGRREWLSHVHAFNTTDEVAVVRRVAVHGPVGTGAFPSGEQHVAPGTGAGMPAILGLQPYFNEFEVPPGVVVSAEVEKVYEKWCGDDPGQNPITAALGQGRVPLPVYRGLFPAGSVVVTNTIALGNPRLTPICAAENEKYFRRVNVTLFNGGSEPGTFRIKVLPLRSSPTPIYETAVTLAAKEVRQVNRLPIPIVDTPATLFLP